MLDICAQEQTWFRLFGLLQDRTFTIQLVRSYRCLVIVFVGRKSERAGTWGSPLGLLGQGTKMHSCELFHERTAGWLIGHMVLVNVV